MLVARKFYDYAGKKKKKKWREEPQGEFEDARLINLKNKSKTAIVNIITKYIKSN